MRGLLFGIIIGMLAAIAGLYYYNHGKPPTFKKAKPVVQGVTTPQEISGVVYDEDKKQLILVGDENPGVFFLCEDKDDSDKRIPPAHTILKKFFEIEDCTTIAVPNGITATDFESIDIVKTGQYLILSESLRALLISNAKTQPQENPIRVQYPNAFAELGGHGLEGLAIKKNAAPKKGYDVTVLWEGGYPEARRMVDEMAATMCDPPAACPTPGSNSSVLSWNSYKPVIVRYENEVVLETSAFVDLSKRDTKMIEIDIPLLPTVTGTGLELLKTQRFRATDLVYSKTPSTGKPDTDPAYIVLLGSTGVPVPRPHHNEGGFEYTCLVEVTSNGALTGKYLDVKSLLAGPTGHLNAFGNWEGLSWYKDGQLLLVNDNDSRTPLTALIVDGPAAWPTKTANSNSNCHN